MSKSYLPKPKITMLAPKGFRETYGALVAAEFALRPVINAYVKKATDNAVIEFAIDDIMQYELNSYLDIYEKAFFKIKEKGIEDEYGDRRKLDDSEITELENEILLRIIGYIGYFIDQKGVRVHSNKFIDEGYSQAYKFVTIVKEYYDDASKFGKYIVFYREIPSIKARLFNCESERDSYVEYLKTHGYGKTRKEQVINLFLDPNSSNSMYKIHEQEKNKRSEKIRLEILAKKEIEKSEKKESREKFFKEWKEERKKGKEEVIKNLKSNPLKIFIPSSLGEFLFIIVLICIAWYFGWIQQYSEWVNKLFN